MDAISNAIFSVTIFPASTEQTARGSVLPDRFVSGTRSQETAIVGADLGSTVNLSNPIGAVIVPVVLA